MNVITRSLWPATCGATLGAKAVLLAQVALTLNTGLVGASQEVHCRLMPGSWPTLVPGTHCALAAPAHASVSKAVITSVFFIVSSRSWGILYAESASWSG